MPKATLKNITSKTKCPATLMAKLIGAHMDLHNDLDDLRLMKSDVMSRMLIDRGKNVAIRMQETASEAIALAPAKSLQGAVAKLIVALFHLGEVADQSDMDRLEVGRREFLSRTLAEDALAYIDRAHGINPENLGLASYVAQGPNKTLRAARGLVPQVTS